MIGCTFVAILHNFTKSYDFSTVIVRIVLIIFKAILQIRAEVHTGAASHRLDIFFELAGASVLFIAASPIRVEDLETLHGCS